MTEAEVQETLHRASTRFQAHLDQIKSSPPAVVKPIPSSEREAFERAIAFKIARGTDNPRRKYDIGNDR